jgi:hypothetical protein
MKRLLPLALIALLAHGPACAERLAIQLVEDAELESEIADELAPEATPAAATPAPPPNRLLATDGSELPGTLGELVAGSAGEAPDLLWLAAPTGEPLRLKQAKVLEMRQDAPTADPGEHYALLTLNNRDSLRGELVALDEENVTLRTRFAGDLKFRRDMIESLHIVHRPTSLYSGPKPGDFTLTSQGWSQKGDSLIAKGGRAITKIAYPECFRLAMDIEWKLERKAQPHFAIAFLAKDNAGRASGGYEFSCQGDYIDMRKREGIDADSLGDGAELSGLDDKDKMRLELLVDTRSGLILMLIDGRLVQEWTDASPVKPDAANVLELAAASGGQELRVSSINLATWDGNRGSVTNEDSAIAASSAPTGPQTLLLRNGDTVQVDQVFIKEGKISAKTNHGDVIIPISRASLVGLKKPAGNPPTPKKRSGDVRAWLPDGSRLTFRLDSLREGKITGSSQQFGTAEFDLKAFERIEMNLGNLDLERQRPRLNW